MGTPAATTSLLVLSSVGFGLVPLFGRVLLDLGLSSEAIALYRFCLALPLALACLPRRRAAIAPALAIGGSGLAVGLGWTTYLEAIEHVTLASAGVIYMSYPLFVVLLARLLVGHRLTARALVGAMLIITGASVVNTPGVVPAELLPVLVSSLVAPIGFALAIVALVTAGEGLSTLERWSLLCVGTVVGVLPAALAQDPGALLPATSRGWLWIIALAAVTATIPQLLYIFAARRVLPARAAACGAVELPTMIAVGWLAFGEDVGMRETVGAALVITAIAVTPALPAPQRRGRATHPATAMDASDGRPV